MLGVGTAGLIDVNTYPNPLVKGVVRGKLADHVGDHVVLSPEGVVLVPSPGTESFESPPPTIVETLRYNIMVSW